MLSYSDNHHGQTQTQDHEMSTDRGLFNTFSVSSSKLFTHILQDQSRIADFFKFGPKIPICNSFFVKKKYLPPFHVVFFVWGGGGSLNTSAVGAPRSNFGHQSLYSFQYFRLKLFTETLQLFFGIQLSWFYTYNGNTFRPVKVCCLLQISHLIRQISHFYPYKQ